MRGTCENCLEQQKKGIADYCCVLCVIKTSGLNPSISKDEHGTTVIDLSGRKDKPGRIRWR